jgi:hypothetical protein
MRKTTKVLTMGLATAAMLFATNVLTVPAEASSGNQQVRLRDDCDAATFNAVLGAGACKGNGGTTFQEFNNELAQKGSVGAWEFNPDHTGINRTTQLTVVNQGGETHTFTQVANFGGGFVAGLNKASGNLTPAPECAIVMADGSLKPQPASPTNIFVPSGGTATGPVVGPRLIRFQCCIHPWMRLTITAS